MLFRIVCCIAAVFAFAAIPAAQAQPKICKKVDVSFACRNGGSGKATLNCRNGESEARCCARLRRRAADPRRGYCTGRAGGLISFRCGCAKKGGGGGGDDRRLERLAPLDGPEPGGESEPDQESKGNVEYEFKVEKGERVKPAGPRLRGPGPKGGRACRQVRYKFSCRGRGGAEGKAACTQGEGKAACCRRVAQLARKTCARTGGVARFECDCTPKGGARDSRRRGWRAGERPGLGRTGDRPALRGKVCSRVSFTYTCRGRRREGGRECRRNEKERACCAHAFSVETRNCGRAPENWKCGCTEDSRRPLERLR